MFDACEFKVAKINESLSQIARSWPANGNSKPVPAVIIIASALGFLIKMAACACLINVARNFGTVACNDNQSE